MREVKLYRYAYRNGMRQDDSCGEVTWKVRTTKDGLYVETESNVYFYDVRNKEDDDEVKMLLSKGVEQK